MPEAMKHGLGRPAVERIAASLAAVSPGFPEQAFCSRALDGLPDLELKDRVRHIIRVLREFLPRGFSEAAACLEKLGQCWMEGDPDDPLRGFAAWPVIDYVGEYGLEEPERALETLRRLTPLFSAEFAIRAFIVRYPQLTYARLEEWTADPDEHVRRLVSEGSRPRLPWGRRLQEAVKDPSRGLALLERLKDDPSEYVRRSVANHLNDVSKDHPGRVVTVCRAWLKDAGPNRRRLVRHATRTLVKQGHPEVFGLLGFTQRPRVELLSLDVSPATIRMGDAVAIVFELRSRGKSEQKLVVDYAVHHVRADGKTKPKVFKYRSVNLAPGEAIRLRKVHAVRPVTTRRYYPGEHAVEVLVNGRALGRKPFVLGE
ncbi:MAG: hypothetical protein V2I79_10680 [Xanthomonadales bacterium]|jgi:3-methyladenine DNA glycosylase AlkC|nr:hypothetical protein [Xanthomonadales bacterium]